MRTALREALESSHTSTLLLDGDGAVLECDPRSRIPRQGAREMIGSPIWLLDPSLDEACWVELSGRARADGIAELETLGARPDGSCGPMRIRLETVPALDAQARYLMRTEPLPPRRDAPHDEDWFRCITNHGEDGFWAYQMGTAEMVFNPRWYAMLGCAPQATDAVEAVIERLHPDDFEAVRADFVRLVAGEIDKVSGRLRIRHADGEYRWFRHRAYVAARSPDGQPTWLMGHDVDITAEVVAETLAVERERELNALVERIATAVLVFGPDGLPRRWNPAASTLVGSQNDLGAVIAERHHTGWDVLDEHGAPMPRAELPLFRALRTGQPVWNRVLGVADGKLRRWALMSAAPAFDDAGQVIDVVCTITDITETRRLEAELAQRHRLESLGRLAGGMAHDFNNLLTVIASGAELLADELPPRAPGMADVAEIRAAAERGAALTRQLLGYARRQRRTPRILSLQRQLGRHRGLIRRLLPSRATLSIDAADDIWPVHIDPVQVEQILMSLAANAGEALDGGRGSVRISLRNAQLEPTAAESAADHPGSGDFVVLAVIDDGRGMSVERLQQATEPFFTTKPVGTSAGLGLSTCLGITRQNGGRLTLDSEPGLGTTVEVWLPRAHGPVSPSTRSGPMAPLYPSATILVVDGEHAVGEAIRRALRKTPWTVYTATDGNGALSLVQSGLCPDLVLTDVALPGTDGPTLVAQLRMRWPDLPALFTSGHDDEVLDTFDFDRTAGDFLPKPFDARRLRAHIAALLNGSDAPGDTPPG